MRNTRSKPPLSMDSENQRKYFSKGALNGWNRCGKSFFIKNDWENISLKPLGEKTRGSASLHHDILPPGTKGYFGGICAAKG